MTVALVMIVRDEEATIGRCLRSVAPLIDHWTICDTGSIDATEEIARSFLKDIPGQWFDDEWRDFGHNRSLALERARGSADYLLLMDADMELVAGPLPELTADAYALRIDDGTDFHYRLPALIRGDLEWRSEGATHEALAPTRQTEALDAWTLRHHLDGSRRPRKQEEDLALLQADLARNPQNARAAFYLAQTLNDLGRWAEAIGAYQHRLALGGWIEELFYARYQLGCLLIRYVDFDEGAEHLHCAIRLCPERAEPYRALAYAANHIADQKPLPGDGALFVHADQYRQTLPADEFMLRLPQGALGPVGVAA